MDLDINLYTVSQLARILGVERHRIEYLLDTRPIAPRGRVGNARVFDAAAVEHLRRELHAAEQTHGRAPEELANGPAHC